MPRQTDGGSDSFALPGRLLDCGRAELRAVCGGPTASAGGLRQTSSASGTGEAGGSRDMPGVPRYRAGHHTDVLEPPTGEA